MKTSYLSVLIIFLLSISHLCFGCDLVSQKEIAQSEAIKLVSEKFPTAQLGVWYYDFQASSPNESVNYNLVKLAGGTQLIGLIKTSIGSNCTILKSEVSHNYALAEYLTRFSK